MKKFAAAFLLTSVSIGAVSSPASNNAPAAEANLKPICLLSGLPPLNVSYKPIKKVKAAKNSYGSVNDVIPIIVNQARKLGADAIISYNGAQRFGFFPWQFVRPTATGHAVKWLSPEDVDCEGMGGTYSTRLNGSLTKDA